MELLSFLLLHTAARFYRVEVAETLFGDYAVSREWGARGRPGQRRQRSFGNLREAVVTADRWQRKAQARGYRAPEDME